MNRILTRILFCLTLIGVPVAASAADLPVLTVYTYNSFISDWGPGPQVKKAFEAGCACHLDFVGVEDGVVLLSRLRLEGPASKADVVLGRHQPDRRGGGDRALRAPWHGSLRPEAPARLGRQGFRSL